MTKSLSIIAIIISLIVIVAVTLFIEGPGKVDQIDTVQNVVPNEIPSNEIPSNASPENDVVTPTQK